MTEPLKDYLYFAQKDAEVVSELAALGVDRHAEAIAYHCQQLAEKMLKAVFVHMESEPEWTHNIWHLLRAIDEHGWIKVPADIKSRADGLTACETAGRYTSALDIDRGEALEAIDSCRTIADLLHDAGFVAIYID